MTTDTMPATGPSAGALRPLRPTLYRLAADGRTLDFLFAACDGCGKLTFPANAPGCMHCGSPLDEAGKVARPGGGTLLEFITLHVPLVPGMPAPSIAADIRIADDIVEEGVVAMPDESSLRPGMAMTAIAVPNDDGATFRCAFVPAGEQTDVEGAR